MKNIILDKYKTLPIGTIFTYKGNKYEVCKYNWTTISSCCSLCAFCGINCDKNKSVRGECYSARRLDNSNIYFKLLEDNKDNKDNKDINNISNIIPTFNTDNSLNNLHIECSKGYSIDVDNSDLSKGIIKFKKCNITLEDVYENQGEDTFITNVVNNNKNTYIKLLAIAQLMDIASYYNKGWKPIFNDHSYYSNLRDRFPEDDWDDFEKCYYISCQIGKYYAIGTNMNTQGYDMTVYFKSQEDAQAVIDNPNFRDILDAIYKN